MDIKLYFVTILSYILHFYSLREYLEQQEISQFCNVEENSANVTKFMNIFFPDFKIMKSLKLERTLALLRPDLLQERKGRK
jgi:hypothetical protein